VPGKFVVYQELLGLQRLDHAVRSRQCETGSLRNFGQAECRVLVGPTEEYPQHSMDCLGTVFLPSTTRLPVRTFANSHEFLAPHSLAHRETHYSRKGMSSATTRRARYRGNLSRNAISLGIGEWWVTHGSVECQRLGWRANR
jgi:hypothetical protein